MTKVVLRFSISLDGFAAGPDVSLAQPMGRGGERLHEWMSSDAEVVRASFASTGAVVVGRRTYDVGLQHWGDTPYPVPSFVLTHEAREPQAMKSAPFSFVNDGIESAVSLAREAAGGRDVIVMGVDTARQALSAGLAYELQLQLVPVLLGAGARLLDGIDRAPIELRQTRCVASPGATHLTFEVGGSGATKIT